MREPSPPPPPPRIHVHIYVRRPALRSTIPMITPRVAHLSHYRREEATATVGAALWPRGMSHTYTFFPTYVHHQRASRETSIFKCHRHSLAGLAVRGSQASCVYLQAGPDQVSKSSQWTVAIDRINILYRFLKKKFKTSPIHVFSLKIALAKF